MIAAAAEAQHLEQCVSVAFAGTEEARAEDDRIPIDGIYGPEDEAQARLDEEAEMEQDMLDALPLPGNPKGEQERKSKWLALPRRARIAIRRLHRNFKHLPSNALIQMLRAARCPKDYIEVAKSYRCNECEQIKPIPQTHKVAPPKPYTFNAEIGVDVLEVTDSATFSPACVTERRSSKHGS